MEEITYLVANYNNGKYLPECIESILNQTSKRWKCIICDDASTDNSTSVIKPNLSSKIRLIKNEQNIGYTRTLIKLIEEAETDIVGIVDSDDALYHDATENVLSVYEKDRDAGFVYSRYEIYDKDLKKIIGKNGHKIKPGKTTLESGFVSHLKTFRKKIYYSTQGFNEGFFCAEDRDLVYKLEEVTEPIFINKTLYKYRLLNNSISHDIKNRSAALNNHFKAFTDALNRRDINGFERFFYLYVFSLQLSYGNESYPGFIRKMSNLMRKSLIKIDNILNIRSGGKLKRS